MQRAPTESMERDLAMAGHGMDDALGTSSAGRWLFKDKDLLMGPVPASVVIDKLYSGEIGPKTPVADENDDEHWFSLEDVAVFSVHVAKSQARHRVMKDKHRHEKEVRRKTVTRVTVLSVVGAVLAAAVFAVVVWLVTAQPWREEDAALAEIQITVNPPVIALASAEDLTRGRELFLDVNVQAPAAPSSTGRTPRTPRVRPAAAETKASAPAEAGDAPATAAAAGVTSRDADGLGTTRSYDMDQIRSVLNRESRSLFPCIREEVRRSGFSGTIPFAFVINNDGRVGRLWIDERRLRGGEMQQCFETTMAGWRFATFQGERPTVNHSFTIGG